MGYQTYRNFSIGMKIIAIIIILFGLFLNGGSIGAGIYNHDDGQLGEGIQFLAISIGFGISFLIVGSIFDKIVEDIKYELVLEKLEKRRGQYR